MDHVLGIPHKPHSGNPTAVGANFTAPGNIELAEETVQGIWPTKIQRTEIMNQFFLTSKNQINAAHRAGVDEVIDGNLDVKSFCRYRFMILLNLRPAFCLPTLICLPTMGFFQAISTVDFLTDLARRSWSSRMSPLWWSSATDQVVLVVDTMNLIPKSPMGWFHGRKLTSTAVLQSLSCIEMWIKTNMIPLWTEYYSLLGQWLTFKTFWDYIFI